MNKIYLDYAATTPMNPQVIEKMTEAMQNVFGNPSSIHSYGREAKSKLMSARESVAVSIGANEAEIVFNSCATEGNNTVILETAKKRKGEGKHLITTEIEHPSVFNTMKKLENEGYEVTYLPVNAQGEISLSDLQSALRPDTILVSIMMGNNEIGILNPIQEIGILLQNHPAWFHTDAVQAIGTQFIDVNKLGVDFLTLSAHKLGGPKGCGCLYIRKGIVLPSLITGGKQEKERRAGTENLIGIIGMAEALSLHTIDVKKELNLQFLDYWDYFFSELKKNEIEFVINGNSDKKLPHIRNVWFKNIPANLLLIQLDLAGIAVSTGSACSSGNIETSRILRSIYGSQHPALQESIRISFGTETTKDEIKQFVKHLKQIISK